MKKSKIVMAVLVVAFLFASSISSGSVVNAASYTAFSKEFNYLSIAPSDANHLSQTVEVHGTVSAYARAKCTKYNYTGNKPVLTIRSISTKYPTYSTSFSGVDTSGNATMKYTEAIPIPEKTVKFKGSVSNYGKSCNIGASVKG